MASDQVDLTDPTISLSEKLRRYSAQKRRTGIDHMAQRINRWGPAFYCYTIGVGSLWGFLDVLPTTYEDEWLLPVRLLLLLLVVQVTVNWCGMRWVDSEYQPALHGTKPPYLTTKNYEKPKEMTSENHADDGELAGVEGSASERIDGGESTILDVGCVKRTNANGDGPGSGGLADTEPLRSKSQAVDLNCAAPKPEKSNSYDGYSSKMMVATALPTADGKIERKPFPYWSWVPCLMCQRLRPPRCHHCTLCKQCVLKRDHHCYFSGRCVGLNNTRFFLVFLFWAFFLTSFGTYHILPFIFRHMMPRYGLCLYDLIFPVPLIRGVLGYVSLIVTPVVLATYCIFFCNVLSLTIMISSFLLLWKGKTSFERDNRIKVTDTRSLGGKLKSVFGKYWWVNFLVPTYPWFRPVEDAVLWPHIKPW